MKVLHKYNAQFSRWFGGLFLTIYLRVYKNPPVYDSIDTLPIFFWNKIHREGNLSYLLIGKSIHITRALPGPFQQIALSHIWIKIYDQFIARFGFAQEFLDLHRKEKEIAIEKANMIISGDRTRKALIQIMELEYEAMKGSISKFSTGLSFEKSKGYVEAAMGFRINPYECVVSEYQGYLDILKERAAAMKASRDSRNANQSL